ncbi:MAG: diacylglycerol kinase family lipid kinase [Acidobacteria bacterium]|nr:diacylglycerol kinase family lipid kinase [Acidobacteriota bacterium]MBV9475712.1 diacylglycerol kinase family lipid kinase [Acidobacteriota bacterium]
MHLKLIYNPAAGRGRARRRVREVEEYLRSRGARVDCEPSTGPDDLVRIAAESSRGGIYDRVVICGGDGTLNLAIREFDLAKGTLALIPSGSGDDFARVAGIPREVRGACDVALGDRIREVDVALANDIRYLGVAGLGFDSEVADFANRHVKFLRGSAVYLYAILRVLPRFTPRRVRMRTESGTRDERIMFAAVGNTRQYGGGIRITPDASIDDGLLDLCLVRETSRVQLLKTLPRAYTGAHVKSPFVETGRGRAFSFDAERPMAVYADGEPLTRTPVSFALAEQKLRIAVP